MTTQRVLETVKDCYGEETPVAVLYEEGGLLYMWELVCHSSKAHNLGNCRCINHSATVEYPISTDEVISRFGVVALDGFGVPGWEQEVFDAFGVEVNELESFLRLSYRFGLDPLPSLRNATGQRIVFGDDFGEDPDRLAFPEEEPGTIFLVNSDGKISWRYPRLG